jgi:hypothetical protein
MLAIHTPITRNNNQNGSMIRHVIQTLTLNEVRLRIRRISTLVALFAIIALSWLMIADPSQGTSMMVANKARVLYTSSALAFASATLVSPLFALFAFYLIRGRIGEDLRSGIGSVIGATQVGNSLFLFSRWLGGVAYLISLMLLFMLSTIVCQLVRGEGTPDILIYLQTYAIILLPMIFFGASCAILFDSLPFTMGKAGDVIFFFIWCAQFSMLPQLEKIISPQMPLWMMFDFTGMSASILTLKQHLNTSHFSLGASTFNPQLTPLTIPTMLWGTQVIWLRLASAGLALLPLLPAFWLFHRYSPDRVKPASSRLRRSPIAVLNDWLRPASKLAQPMFQLAAVMPGFWGKVISDIALTLVASPLAVVAVIIIFFTGLFSQYNALPGVLVAAVGFWGVLMSDLSTRDFSANIEAISGAVEGGSTERYIRQLAAANLLGYLFMGVIAVRWSLTMPSHTLALLTGIFSLSALATLAGRCSRTSRTFVSVFLVWIYIALNAPEIPMFDIVGFNHAANTESILIYLSIGICAVLAGVTYNRYQGE